MSLKLRPVGDRIVVEPIEQEETFAGGALMLPETAKDKPQQGRVLAVGPGPRDEDGEYIKMDFKRGDIVLFARYAGTELKLDNQKIMILRENEVLAILMQDDDDDDEEDGEDENEEEEEEEDEDEENE